MGPVYLTQGKYVLAQCLFLYAWLEQKWLFTNMWEKNKEMKDQTFMHEKGKMPLENNSKTPKIPTYYIGRMIRRDNAVQSKYF